MFSAYQKQKLQTVDQDASLTQTALCGTRPTNDEKWKNESHKLICTENLLLVGANYGRP